jgi:glutathione S-transferase
MIVLHGFGAGLGLPDVSPFVTKVEMLLKFAGLEYRVVTGNSLRAPKRKLPIIEEDGRIVADSTFIRWYLEERHGVDFDAGLDAAERAQAWAFERLLEDHIYWAYVHARWIDTANFAAGPGTFFARLPFGVRGAAGWFIRRAVRRRLHEQGMGRHAPDEIGRLAGASLAALSDQLGGKAYLMGDRPCSTDAAMFAFLLGAQHPGFSGPLTEAARGHQNLMDYTARMMAQYYPAMPYRP